MFEDHATQSTRRSRVASLAGSVAIHFVILVVVFHFRSSIEGRLNPYSATKLYVSTVESVPAAVPKVRHIPVLPNAALPILSPPEPVAKLQLQLKPAVDLPTLPELSADRMASLPAPRPPLAAPAPSSPLLTSPVFASALPATPSRPHSAALKTGSFGSVPVATTPATAQLQNAGDTFSTVPVDIPRHGSPTATVLPAGFGTADVTAANLHSGPSVASSGVFGGVAAAAPTQEPAPKPKTTGASFTSAVVADAARQPAAKRQPAAEPLEILSKPRPDYTEEARRARLEGDVVLEVLFTSSGGVRVLRVVRGLGHGLDQNAIDAAGKIRFRPATEDGRAVDTVAMVRISFQIAY